MITWGQGVAELNNEIVLEASYKPMLEKSEISIYPHIIKESQQFILQFNESITPPYQIKIVANNGEEIELLFNSKLSVYEAKSTMTLEVFTPLDPGSYFVVLESPKKTVAKKLLKFGEQTTLLSIK